MSCIWIGLLLVVPRPFRWVPFVGYWSPCRLIRNFFGKNLQNGEDGDGSIAMVPPVSLVGRVCVVVFGRVRPLLLPIWFPSFCGVCLLVSAIFAGVSGSWVFPEMSFRKFFAKKLRNGPRGKTERGVGGCGSVPGNEKGRWWSFVSRVVFCFRLVIFPRLFWVPFVGSFVEMYHFATFLRKTCEMGRLAPATAM